MYAIDTNLLVYAHNSGSSFNDKASHFLENAMNERDENGRFTVCLTSQVLLEFLHVITWDRLEEPLEMEDALEVVDDYLSIGVPIVKPGPERLSIFLDLVAQSSSRRRVFDTALAATLKEKGIVGIFTANEKDFRGFGFLDVQNPLK